LGERDGVIVDETGGLMKRTIVAIVAVLLLVVAGCSSSDPTTSEEYGDLEADLTALESQLEDAEAALIQVTAQRDALIAENDANVTRFETVQEQVEFRNAVATDPSSFGTEQEVLDMLSEGATPGAVMLDEAWGSVPLKEAWRRTLFAGQVDAVTTEWRAWICSDGRTSGSLWTWEGTNVVGAPFSLVGINLNEYNDEGRLELSTVIWPYAHEYVYEEFGTGR
jgi:hypothetical protein